MPSPYRLAIVDLDDTLLGHDKQVSPANLAALARLRAAGLEIVIASGRHHLNIASFADVTQCRGWIISSAGALVRHATSGETLHDLTLPPALAIELLHCGKDAGYSQIGYHGTGIFVEEFTPWIELDSKRSGHPARLGDLHGLALQGLQKLMWSTEAATIDALQPVMEETYRGRLYVVHTEPEMVEFLSVEANKARGALAVAERLCIAREEVVAFGDGNNDVPILQWAGMSVAMDHGRAAAHRAAKLVTPPGPHGEAFARAVDLVLKPEEG